MCEKKTTENKLIKSQNPEGFTAWEAKIQYSKKHPKSQLKQSYHASLAHQTRLFSAGTIS